MRSSILWDAFKAVLRGSLISKNNWEKKIQVEKRDLLQKQLSSKDKLEE